MTNIDVYYLFKIIPRFWLVKTTLIIHHNQVLLFSKGFIHLDLQNSSYPTQPHWLIAKYPTCYLFFLGIHNGLKDNFMTLFSFLQKLLPLKIDKS